ncbi:hypothetical protein M8371_32555, partial [Klebsiella pneumoniae]|nr:hypothetical protein [Klebsiella pneumoniae]
RPRGVVFLGAGGAGQLRYPPGARITSVLPLPQAPPPSPRLSNSDQNRVFQPHSGRRIVLATNVAETSLTVPGSQDWIDAGTARICRHSH